jgi:hypothetical protein
MRGDLQQNYGDTYAATLAAKIFRCLIALVAASDLELYLYDVLNVFLNAEFNRATYVRCPKASLVNFLSSSELCMGIALNTF